MATTVQIAKDAAETLRAVPTDAQVDTEYGDAYVYEDMGGNVIASLYLGSYLHLDPCGRYHHMLSPNGATRRCEDFWDSLERQLDKRGLGMEGGEGDPADIYVTRWLRDVGPDEAQGEE